MDEKIIYFELNNWMQGKDYPACEPFLTWLANDFKQAFRNDEWCRENHLVVRIDPIDMSTNYCISATESWVRENCPMLLDNVDYAKFLRYPEIDEDGYTDVYSNFGVRFRDHCEDNYGCEYYYEDL